MPIRYQKMIYRTDLKSNRDILYVFGDNIVQEGLAGQAKEMRGEPNAVGIPTKYIPATSRDAYFSDDSWQQVHPYIEQAFQRIDNHLRNGGIVVFPEDGVGTGLAKLEKKAPRIAYTINQTIRVLEMKYGVIA